MRRNFNTGGLDTLRYYREIWLVDFEFQNKDGERPVPICMVAWEVHSGERIRLWEEELPIGQTPFDIGPQSLFVAYFGCADLGCFRALDWPMPARVLDLFTEFRNLTNGLQVPCGNSLIGALTYFGLPSIDVAEKETMRDLIKRGGPWSDDERHALLTYCQRDVEALSRLLPVMAPRIFLPHSLLRGRSMSAVSAIERNGVPINLERLDLLRANWEDIKKQLINRFDAEYGIFEGQEFRQARFEAWLSRHSIPWPRLESGALDLKEETFRDMANFYPVVRPIKDLRYILSQLRLNALTVGSDARNRCLVSPFATTTSRNAPSNAKFAFGPATWIRNLIEPPPGYGLGYLDWCQQEFGIAAALSEDPKMQAAYQTGSSYLAFGKKAGRVPEAATKKTHPQEHEFFKTLIHGIDYGMQTRGLALRLNCSEFVSRELLEAYQTVFARFWKWRENAIDHAVLNGWQATVFGWTFRIAVAGHAVERKARKKDGKKDSNESFNPRSLLNFWMQANGAEMLRLACCLGSENGIEICCSVHDAILICAPLDRLAYDVERMRGFMVEAARIVLGGFELHTEANLILYPEHYSDPRGAETWQAISSLCRMT